MRNDVLQTLRKVNDSFYQTFGEQFAETRQRVQPGVLRALESLENKADLLDLGCGSAPLVGLLFDQGHTGRYVGIDNSEILLALARDETKDNRALFYKLDMNQERWAAQLLEALPGWGKFDRILCFAALHHIPGQETRRKLLNDIHRLLSPAGRLHLSVWDFLVSERMRSRIIPWEQIELAPVDVEEGDYLLDWRRGGTGLRYVHHFTPEELGELAGEASFNVIETYRSDGENGRLGLYQVWAPVSST